MGAPTGSFGTFFNDAGGQFIQTGGTLTVNAAAAEAAAGSFFTVQSSAAINFQSRVGGTLAGSFTAAGGAQVSFGDGLWTLEFIPPGTMFGGNGTYTLQADATFIVTATDSVRAQNFVMSGGVLRGDGDFGAASFTWTGGSMFDNGRTYELPGDVMTLSGGVPGDGGASHTLNKRTLLNQGTVYWQYGAGDIRLSTGSTIVNDGDEGLGVFEAAAEASIFSDDDPPTNCAVVVENGGQFTKPSDEYLGYQWASVAVPFRNDRGTAEVDGSLTVSQYFQTGGLTKVGATGSFTITAQDDVTVPFDGITAGDVQVSGVLSFAARTRLWGGTFLMTGGTIATNSGSPAPWGGGTIGALSLGPNAVLKGSGTINAQLVNDGTIAPGNGASFGSIVVMGVFGQEPGASLLLKFGGTAGNDVFQVQKVPFGGALQLGNVSSFGGTLQVTLVNGYEPPSESEFMVFSWATEDRPIFGFDSSVLIGPDGNIAHQTQYNPDSVGFIVP